ncbi:hypothetical protein AB0M57_11315 [Streptomyces sp. NPDC051597]|uniref:hypothetical protein n=1 Tax=Streptomyces sp. NPDC051597 TaxID=3155049 RepID=UPI003430A97F
MVFVDASGFAAALGDVPGKVVDEQTHGLVAAALGELQQVQQRLQLAPAYGHVDDVVGTGGQRLDGAVVVGPAASVVEAQLVVRVAVVDAPVL